MGHLGAQFNRGMTERLTILYDISVLTARPLIGVGKITVNLLEAFKQRDDLRVIKFALVARGWLPQLRRDYPDVVAPQIPARISNHLVQALQKLSLPVDVIIHPADVVITLDWSCFRIRSGVSVAIVADATPISHPEWYNREITALFGKRLESIKRNASLVVAISNFTKEQLVRLTKIPEDMIVVAYPGISAQFRAKPKASVIRRIQKKYGLAGKFLLYVGIQHPRKNLRRLFSAYASLPKKDTAQYGLVVVGTKDEAYRLEFPRNVRSLGYVSDADLPAIYAASSGLVYPSFIEGFGLPIVEAFAMGTPVLTGRTSSMKEIAQDAAIVVNPHSEADITRGLVEMMNLTDTKRRALIESGKKRLRSFSFERMADTVVREIRKGR